MRRFDDWPLRWKMLILIVLVSVVPLAVTASVEWRESSRLFESSTNALVQANAEDIASDLDSANEAFQRSAARVARQPAVIRFARQRSPELARETADVFESYVASDQRLRGVALLDTDGRIVVATEPQMVGVNFAFRRYFRDAVALGDGLAFALPLHLRTGIGLEDHVDALDGYRLSSGERPQNLDARWVGRALLDDVIAGVDHGDVLSDI